MNGKNDCCLPLDASLGQMRRRSDSLYGTHDTPRDTGSQEIGIFSHTSWRDFSAPHLKSEDKRKNNHQRKTQKMRNRYYCWDACDYSGRCGISETQLRGDR